MWERKTPWQSADGPQSGQNQDQLPAASRAPCGGADGGFLIFGLEGPGLKPWCREVAAETRDARQNPGMRRVWGGCPAVLAKL